MIAAPDQLRPVRSMEDLLKQLLPSSKYKNIQFWKQGGTRDLYITEWGLGCEKRIIKVDRSELESPRAKRHVERGCDTSNDIRALSEILNPERHNLMRLVDYYDLSETQGITVAVERHFESQSLEEKIQEKPLKLKEFETVFAQVIEGSNYLINTCGMYHRDLKASNILVNDELEIRITDFANACKKEEVKRKYMPTAGGHWVSDPLVFFNGSENEYREASEIYAVGTEMFYALTGEHIFEYDADEGIGVSCATRENMLSENGIVDRKRHNTTLDDALKRLPKKARKKYGKVIKKCLSLDEEIRYTKVSKLKRDFTDEKNVPSWFKYLTSKLVLSTALLGTTAFAAAGLGIMFDLENQLENSQATAEESAKYQVRAEWNGPTLTINNNLVELNLGLYLPGSHSEDDTRKFDDYPEFHYLELQPGEELFGSVSLSEIAGVDSASLESLSAQLFTRMYIEGFPAQEEFHIHVKDHSDYYVGQGMMGFFQYPSIEIPENISPGTYNLIVEVYAPTEEQQNNSNSKGFKNLKFSNPESVILRDRIPIVVGNPTISPIKTSYMEADHGPSISVGRLEGASDFETLPANVIFETTLIGEDYYKQFGPCSNSNSCHTTLSLPRDIKDQDERILQIVARDKNGEGDIIYYTFIPMRHEILNEKIGYGRWRPVTPGPEFYETTVKLGEALRAESHDQPGEGTVGKIEVSD